MSAKKKPTPSQQPKTVKGTGEAPIEKTADRAAAKNGAEDNPEVKAKHSITPIVTPDRFPIVGLGASAGGLEALEDFFQAMPSDSGMAFIVVMHQSANHVSLLPSLLDKHTSMDVMPICDRMTVEQNCIYVVPPGMHVDVFDGMLFLTDLPERHEAPLPIDYFFCSLAEERRENAVAIVLSGTGTDGTLGSSAVKGQSGMVIVQSIDSAKFSGMPQNAISAGLADYVLPPDQMPAKLIAYAQGSILVIPNGADEPTTLLKQSLPEILLELRRQCGHDFAGYKTSTIGRRIQRRMNLHQLHETKQYLKYLKTDAKETKALFDDLLIGVTSFFRDPPAFEALSKHAIVPLLKDKNEDAKMRVWVPACATGEEAYSIAILLRECMDELKINRDVQIFATDLDGAAIETARTGFFPSGIAADVSAKRLSHFFSKQGDGYQIRKGVREWLVFAPQNVIHDPPFTKLDLVSCRNLLIYLKPPLQTKLLSLFHYSLRPGGRLFLGSSESIGEFGDRFEILDAKSKVFARKESSLAIEREIQFPVVPSPTPKAGDSTVPKEDVMTPLRYLIAETLAAEFAPPTVVVNDQGGIVHVHGRTGQFLELAPGDAPQNVIAMAREGLDFDLSSALHLAARQTRPIVRENIKVRNNGDTVSITLVVQRLSTPTALQGLLQISFLVDNDGDPSVDPEEASEGRQKGPVVQPREKATDVELQQARESLQQTIEELDASKEEMRSFYEEMQSTNEELQSSNEELETSKEELQSLNEELQTVNSELQEKIDELSLTNDDMNNLLNSTDIATLFLDNSLHIKRFTEQASQIIRLIPSDVGRSLGDLTSRLRYKNLVPDCEQVLKSLVPREQEVQTDDEHWLLMRILPYRTSDDRINGLVMAFIDIDDSVKAREETVTLMERIVSSVREPLLAIGEDLRVQFANRAYCDAFKTDPDVVNNQSVYELCEKQWDIDRLRKALGEVIESDTSFEDLEFSCHVPSDGIRQVRMNARRVTSKIGYPTLILLAIEILDRSSEETT